MDKITALKKTEMFGSLTAVELRAVSAICTERRLKKGEILFVAGETALGLYVIVKGSLRAYRTNKEGREQTIHVEKAGSTIAEVPVFDGQPYPSTVSAEEESDVLFISKGDVQRVFLSHPAIALGAVKLLASRLRKTSALAEALSLQEVDQRLAAFLWQEFKDKGLKKIALPNNSAIAARLGSVREVVSRALSKLEREKLVSIDKRHQITLLNPQGLKDYTGC
jgi:CRP/FNR family transcriptional regulator